MANINNSNIISALPPLATLPAFEAAARFGSFSKAAQELNSSQPAISLQIRQLEQAMGRKLFRRKSQGVQLTEAGQELLAVVQPSLADLRGAMLRLRQPGTRIDLTVATDFAFAAHWLLPRLDRFKAEMPLVDVRILTAQHVDDLGGASADLTILFGEGRSLPEPIETGIVTADRLRLFAETVFPVCTAAYAQQMPGNSPDRLAQATLLHLDDVAAGGQLPQRHAARWFRWSDWFDAAGLGAPIRGPQLRFNNYTLVLQAAIAGQGVALGWSPLVEPLLAAGQLVIAHDVALRSSRGYVAQLLRDERRPARLRPAGAAAPEAGNAAQRFLAWLQREAMLTARSNVIQSNVSTVPAPRPR